MQDSIPHRLTPVRNGPTDRVVKVPAGQDRFGLPLQLSNWRFECKVSGRDTSGGLCVYDTIRTAKGGPPLHVHREQDEWFFVRRGEFLFKIGDNTHRLKSGDTLLGPRRVPHAFACVSDEGTLMIAFQPAGTIEQLFQDIGLLRRAPTLDDWKAIACKHGVDVIGPPLDVS